MRTSWGGESNISTSPSTKQRKISLLKAQISQIELGIKIPQEVGDNIKTVQDLIDAVKGNQ